MALTVEQILMLDNLVYYNKMAKDDNYYTSKETKVETINEIIYDICKHSGLFYGPLKKYWKIRIFIL